MKKWLFILAICNSVALLGQEVEPCPEFNRIMRDAEQAEKAGDYRNAILRYNAAERCNPAMSADIDDRILKVFDKIEQLRKKAESAQRAAEREKRTAQDEARKARIAEARAEDLRERAEMAVLKMTQQKNRADEETLRAERKGFEAKSSALAAKAQRLQWENPTLAIRLAEAAFQMYAGDDAREAMHDILSYQDNTFYYKEILTGSPVQALAQAPDASLFVTGNDMGVCRIWETDGKNFHEFKAHNGALTNLVFSPTGQYFASTGIDSSVHFWNLKGELIRSLPKQKAIVRELAISLNGDQIATCDGVDSIAWVWGFDGALIHELKGHSKDVNAIAFSPDGNLLVTGSSDNTAIVWRSSSGEALNKFNSDGGIFAIAFSPNGQDILLGSGKPQIWRFQENQSFVFDTNYDPISTVAFSPDEQFLATNNMLEPDVIIWQSNGRKYLTLNGHAAGTSVNAIVFSPDYRTVITAGEDGSIKFWDIYANLQMTYDGHDSYISSVAFSPDGSTLATASADMTAKIWAINGQQLQVLAAHSGGINDLVFSPDGNHLLTGSEDSTAILWNLDGTVANTLKGHTGGITAVEFSKTGAWMLTASQDSTARIWDKNGKTIFVFKAHQGGISSIQMTNDGNHILTGSWDGTIRLWNEKGQEKMVLRPESTDIKEATVSSDSTLKKIYEAQYKNIKAATVSSDGHIAAITDYSFFVWNARGEEILRRDKNPDLLFSIAFSTDGQSLITGDYLGHVILWDLNGRKIATLRNRYGSVNKIACSPDGNHLFVPGSFGGGDTASLWLMPSAWLRYGIAPMTEADIITYGIREFLEDYGK